VDHETLFVMSHTVPVSEEGGRDPLKRMRVYQIARELLRECWPDADKLRYHPVTAETAGQLYAAVGSISANLGEGYSRSSGRDRARIFEYALSSVRESMAWYEGGEPVLGSEIVRARLDKLEEMRRLLLAIIPSERDSLIRPSSRRGPISQSIRPSRPLPASEPESAGDAESASDPN
jgi:four helix bundle protein